MKKTLFTIVALVMAMTVQAKVTLPDQIGDYMVLQQQTNAKLWGWAKAGASVQITCSWNDAVVKTKADKNGRWEAFVATPAASFDAQTVTISDGEPVQLNNVLIGEVWLASGQSNMEMPLMGFWNCPIEGANQVVARANDYKGKIRFATMEHPECFTVQDRVAGAWKDCTPENAPRFGATAFFFAQNLSDILNVPVGIVNTAWGGSRVEGWMPADILKEWGEAYTEEEIKKEPQGWLRSEIMYNGVLAPVMGYTICGFIWYQGCSNIDHDKDYTERFAKLITMFRQWWGQGDLPFYYVEIAPYNYGEGRINGPLLREAQYKTQFVVPNSAMVSTNDLVSPWEVNQIHPKNKKDVGQRLSYLALQNDYHIGGIYSRGPEYKSMEVKDGKAYVLFNYAEDGFSRMQDAEGFEICGEDRNFVKAEVKINPNNQRELIISSDKVPAPVAVRYAFKNFQIGNMAGVHGLPVVPFRTDDF